ncbi:DUF2258 domain-containing protein [Staphylothermus hellenicus]|uniref:Uncharacterized conserved protein UCP037214 n=1 Tax=Staphylothermus hellenicus (strain DSM 12710 / JCM 10830 / BK20S6-10-b1 / P8) TaxID=591019 RepID=D7D9F8_STAHD|nr:DUF2258 domain-containing protein [Staphylothermus hellenicus]ADI32404.1 Uncharacterized conserved protein UCP037214 [Staphylothermus hellenicus DSM 12710]
MSEGTERIENELSTGLVIAGAYANKLRRTLFAQLRDLVKKNKEFAREVARASGEINRLLYIILVENLGCDKGDVVRIRVKYVVDPSEWRIKWNYDTLRIEYFKRQPDEKVMEVVKKVLKEKLADIQKQYREAPTSEEAEKILRGEVKTPEEEWAEEKEEKTLEVMGSTQPIVKEAEKPVAADIRNEIATVDPIGETLMGGAIFRIASSRGENIGIASLEPHAGGWIIDAIIIKEGKAFRAHLKAQHNKEEYMSKPDLLADELRKSSFIEISKKDAESIIKAKMEEIT